MKIILAISIVAYLILNVYVFEKINTAFYLSEERRKLHKIVIWILPFLGPLMLRSFWRNRENDRLKVILKKDRKIKRDTKLKEPDYSFEPPSDSSDSPFHTPGPNAHLYMGYTERT